MLLLDDTDHRSYLHCKAVVANTEYSSKVKYVARLFIDLYERAFKIQYGDDTCRS